MKKAVHLSLCINAGQNTRYFAQLARGLPYPVQITKLLWEEAWKVFTDYAVFKQGVDVSQVGAPQVGDLVAMNALRPFTQSELDLLGGKDIFDPVAWQSSSRVIHDQVWAIPWTADPRVLFYWRDALERARVEETGAFQDLNRMEQTLAQLQASGFDTPWALPNAHPLAALHSAASWVWGAGGDFIRQDGKRTLFCSPPAMEGWLRYFNLFRYMPRKDQPLTSRQNLDLFVHRQTAVTMGSMYMGVQLRERLPPQDRFRVGIALPPGPALVGGSSLVIWAHSQLAADAITLIARLISPAVMAEYCQHTGYLPTRLDILSNPPFSTETHYIVCVQALQTGRPFPVVKVGGLLENTLANALANIWQEVFRNEGQDIETHLHRHLIPLGRRLDITLSQF